MTLLPIAERELRVAARRKGTYRVRAYVTFVALCVSGWVYLVSLHLQPAQLSGTLFNAVAILAFIYALMAGTRVTADCLSEEKREGTLGLLFLTDLKGYDVVFGKLAATSMNSFYGILSLLPVMAIPLLMGGVALDMFWRTAVVLLNTLFFSLAAGIFMSSLCRNERKAMGATFLWIALFTLGVPGLGGLYVSYILQHASDEAVMPFFLTSPIFSFATNLVYGRLAAAAVKPMNYFWWSLLVIHLLAWLFLIWACRRVPRSWQDRPASLAKLRWRDTWLRWCHGDAQFRKQLRRELLDQNPFLWLAGRDRLMRSLVWAVLAGLGVLFFWGYMEYREEWLNSATAIAAAIVLHTTLKLWVASESSRRFIEERREGSLELLLCTPLTVREIILGQRLAMRRFFGRPMVVILGVDFLLMWMALRDQMSTEDRRLLGLLFLAGMIMFVADYYALLWVGMWQGLAAKNMKNAGATALVYVLVLPWIVWLALMTFFVIFFQRVVRVELTPTYAVALWFILGAITDWVWAGWSFHQLHRQFRTVALQRLQPAAPRRFWRFLKPNS